MSDSTNTSTTANDLDLLYLKGIMESPVVRCLLHPICTLTFDVTSSTDWVVLSLRSPASGAGGESEGPASVAGPGEQRGAAAGDPQGPGPLQAPLQHCGRAGGHPDAASLPGVEGALSSLSFIMCCDKGNTKLLASWYRLIKALKINIEKYWILNYKYWKLKMKA